ncbi:MAG TPA: hypothetical protein VE219_01365, partial [Candidatus Sulfotelmatobacter sp.]|nr:hypothetical protein [Candidatus Sulfotelmatobacter sp.]
YAVGVFLAFTMSQAGMVTRWLRRRERGWKKGLMLNSTGMTMTALVLLVTSSAKFLEGAWIIVIIIPTLVALFLAVHRHYAEVSTQITPEIPTSPSELKTICVVPVADLNVVALQSLAMARAISDQVFAIHLTDDPEGIAKLKAKWRIWGDYVPLEIIETPRRSMLRPFLNYIDAIDRQRSDDTLVVILPELVATTWWHQLLHRQTALRMKAALLFRPGTVVVNVPYHLTRGERLSRRRRRRADLEAI